MSKTAKPGVTRPDWTYAYDDLDKLISVSRNGIEMERYRYDALGRRSVIETANFAGNFERTAIVNNASDRTIDLIIDGAGAAQIQNRYTHGGQVDEPLSLEVFASDGTLDQAYTYHADHLGSIRFITDSVGNIANAYEYDSYGRPGFELETVSQPFRYTGREWDAATELYHYRARQYDPETGKFLQEDPIGFSSGDFNVQRYVFSNPVMNTDPSGLIILAGYVRLTSKNATEAKAQTLFIIGFMEHVAFRQTVIISMRLEAAKAASLTGAYIAGKEAVRQAPCGAAILAGIGRESFSIDTGGGENDALSRRLKMCYNAGATARAVFDMLRLAKDTN